jgi:hypothetical protein
MKRNQPHPIGEHYRVIRSPGARYAQHPHGSFVLQRGQWVEGFDPDTGRPRRIFACDAESYHDNADAAYAAIPPGEPVDRFDAAELVKSFGISV